MKAATVFQEVDFVLLQLCFFFFNLGGFIHVCKFPHLAKWKRGILRGGETPDDELIAGIDKPRRENGNSSPALNSPDFCHFLSVCLSVRRDVPRRR